MKALLWARCSANDMDVIKGKCCCLQDAMLQLWCHETFRIIGDRMWDAADRTWLRGQLDDKLKAIFGTSWDELFGEGKDCPPFVSFMRSTENPPYEPVTDFAVLKVTTHCAPCSAT